MTDMGDHLPSDHFNARKELSLVKKVPEIRSPVKHRVG